MKRFLKKCIIFWMSKIKQVIEVYIDFWIVCLLVFDVGISPWIFLFMANNPIPFLIFYICSFVLWYPLIKIAENELQKRK